MLVDEADRCHASDCNLSHQSLEAAIPELDGLVALANEIQDLKRKIAQSGHHDEDSGVYEDGEGSRP